MGNTTAKDWAKKGYIQTTDGSFKHVSSVTDKAVKVKKLPNLLERAGANKKVMNATKTVVDNIAFDSLLERHMHALLTNAKIPFEFQKTIEIQPKFKYGGKMIRSIKICVDFWLDGGSIIIDTKGHATAVSILKYKLLKYFFFKADQQPTIYMPSTRPECNQLVNTLLYSNK